LKTQFRFKLVSTCSNANLGCNRASGPYSRNGNALDFGAIAVTTQQCFAPAPLEGPLLSAFDFVQTVVQTPTGVDLLDADGQPLIRLVRSSALNSI
jgi:heat shock protein HslJ